MTTLRHKTLASIKWATAIVAIILILGYGFYVMRDLLSGTEVVINSPTKSSYVNEPLLEVSGQVGNISWILFNGGQILADESGKFKQTVMLAPGYNEIEVRVVDKFNREIEKVLRVVYEPKSLTALNF